MTCAVLPAYVDMRLGSWQFFILLHVLVYRQPYMNHPFETFA